VRSGRPDVDAEQGRGLWPARQTVDEVIVISDSAGAAVTLTVAVGASGDDGRQILQVTAEVERVASDGTEARRPIFPRGQALT
jgi:hypothetical protein